jgi:hypothetical protein
MLNKTVRYSFFAILCIDLPVTECGILSGCQRFELICWLHLLNKITSKMDIKVLAWLNLASTFDKLRHDVGVIGVTYLSLFLRSKKPEPIGCPQDGSNVFPRRQIYAVSSCRRPKCKFLPLLNLHITLVFMLIFCRCVKFWFPKANHAVNRRRNKIHPVRGHGDQKEGQRYSWTLSLTWGLNGVGWRTPRLGWFTTGKRTLSPLLSKMRGPSTSLVGYGNSRQHRYSISGPSSP